MADMVVRLNTNQNPAFVSIPQSAIADVRLDQILDGQDGIDIDLRAGVGNSLIFGTQENPVGVAGTLIFKAGDSGGGLDGATIDLIPGAPLAGGVYGGIGIGRTQSSSITIGKYTTTGTGRTIQSFLRGRAVHIQAGDDSGLGSGGITIVTDFDDIRIDGKTGVNLFVDGGVVNALSATSSLITVGTGSSATNVAITVEAKGTGTVKMLSNTGELQIDSANNVRIGTGATGVSTTTMEFGNNGAPTNTTWLGNAFLNNWIIDGNITLKKGDGVSHTIAPQASTTGNGARVNLYSGDAFGGNDTTLDIDTGIGGALANLFIGATNAKAIAIGRNSTAAKLSFFGNTTVVRQDTVEAVTNSVTAGGVNGTIANYTDLIIYANDAAAIRNNFYQVARKLQQIDDALFNYGLVKHS